MAKLDLPSEQQFAVLPHRARVAIAARCARYVLPIVKDFVFSDITSDLIVAVEESLEFAEKFASGLDVGDRDTSQMMILAQIAKTAEKEYEDAHERGDYVRNFEAEAAFCAAWAIDFAARAINYDKTGTQLVRDSIFYAAQAYVSKVLAKRFVIGTSREEASKEGERLTAELSRAFKEDFIIVNDTDRETFPPEIFGPIPLSFEQEKSLKNWQDVPVFISSTFLDMQPERDYLRDVVFPQLEESLRPMLIRPIPVDLRWGISPNNSEEKRKKQLDVLSVCLQEVERCLPFFIALLGDRYGWIPPEENVKEAMREVGAEFDMEGLSVFALEITYAIEKFGNLFFYFREELPYEIMPSEITARYSEEFRRETDRAEKQVRLNLLKQNIRQQFSDQVRQYEVIWDKNINSHTNLKIFGEKVFNDLDKALRNVEHCKTKNIIDAEVFKGENAEEYILRFCNRNHKTLSSTIIAVLCKKNKQAKNSMWLDITLELLLRLDQHDFEQLYSFSGDPIEQIQDLLLDYVKKLPTNLVDLYKLVLARCEKRLDRSFVRSVLYLIANSRKGLRESDLAHAFPRLTQKPWNPLLFANLRRYLKRHIAKEESGRWDYSNEIFHSLVHEAYNENSYRKSVHHALGKHFASLPPTDPARASEAIFHLVRGDDKKTAAELFGEYEGDPMAPGTKHLSAKPIAEFFAEEIINEGKYTKKANFSLVTSDNYNTRSNKNCYLSSLLANLYIVDTYAQRTSSSIGNYFNTG